MDVANNVDKLLSSDIYLNMDFLTLGLLRRELCSTFRPRAIKTRHGFPCGNSEKSIPLTINIGAFPSGED